jgi:hypothetical protein
MKLKKWLSRALVLAMVVALMIPVPVAAKSSKGSGKLVKSVTYYNYNTSKGRFEASSKTTYTYDKKNNPNEIRKDSYKGSFFGIPTGADTQISTLKYKYKGKTPKSMTKKNAAGVVEETRTYKKGLVVRKNGTSNYTWTIDGVEKAGCDTEDKYFTYGKGGFISESAGGEINVYPDGSRSDYTDARVAYAVTLKKGVPTFILTQYTYKDGSISKEYAKFNDKGLVVEEGNIDTKTGAPTATYVYNYTMKKGVVKSVVGYSINSKTKAPELDGMWKFDYTKTKTAKNRYCKMVNDLVNAEVDFNWY